MPKAHNPRRGSMQFWPRKRSRHSLVRIRSWAKEKRCKPLGFIGYKAGMTHLMAVDNRPKSINKGGKISLPATIIECPPMIFVGVSFYKKALFNSRKISSILAEKLPKNLSRKISLPKKQNKKLEEVTEFDNLKLLVSSNFKSSKKPKLLEIELGGSNEDKLNFVKENLGKEITVQQIFEEGQLIDVHAVTKGKGFQGTVKRFGVPIKQHKGEKTKRGIGNLGAWTPKRVDFRVPQPGKMGFHLRTEYNKLILKLGDNGEEVTPKSGLISFGIVKDNYILLHGSVAGSKKSPLVLTAAIRSKRNLKDAFQIKSISL